MQLKQALQKEQLDWLVEALGFRVERRVEKYVVYESSYEKHSALFDICPSCEQSLDMPYVSFCPHCGQKLKWA